MAQGGIRPLFACLSYACKAPFCLLSLGPDPAAPCGTGLAATACRPRDRPPVDRGARHAVSRRKVQAINTRVPLNGYWKEQVKCQSACPVGTDARGYVRAIASGELEQAYLIARGPNPLASICGRVCGAPCEKACRRGEIDKPVAIRALKRFACDSFLTHHSYGGDLVDFLRSSAARNSEHDCEGREELLPLLRSISRGEVTPVTGKSVGIVGGGPAGLAAAHDLALLGFEVTVYESEPVLAGMLALGIPEYRLPRDLIRAEVAVIEELGVRAMTGCRVGSDVSVAELRQRHDAVLLSVGAKRSRMLDFPGSKGPGVLGGVEFLRDVALGNTTRLGHRIVVIGGGNVAYDVGRTVVRQTSLDAARTALRQQRFSEIHLCSLESLEEMPADDVEIIEGAEEGIVRHNGLGPGEIHRDEQGFITAITMLRCTSCFDSEGRFSPSFDAADTVTIACDTVIVAAGQAVDLSFIDPERDGIELDERGLLPCDADSGRSRTQGIYVAGDLAYGPRLLIDAVASGKRTARSIYHDISGRELGVHDTELHIVLADYQREQGYESISRCDPPVVTAGQRSLSQSAEVDLGFDHAQARREASRCLDCGVNTIFNGSTCILCGGCVDVCPSDCLRIVGIERLQGNAGLTATVHDRLGQLPATEASALIKDESACIRCALCAQRCPEGAITMERYVFKREPVQVEPAPRQEETSGGTT